VPILACLLGAAVVRSEYYTNVGINRVQPVPFSHQHHVGGLGLDCRYCHTGVEVSPVAGIPPTHTCMTCHSQLYTQAAMLAPVRESLVNNQPIHWNKVNKLPDYVYFDHSIHVAKGVGCTTCHGPVNNMPLMWQHGTLLMEWCLECHRQPEKFVRDRDAVFSVDWQEPSDQLEKGRQLVSEYKIQTLIHCSTCHR
jgi:hypothetical protein